MARLCGYQNLIKGARRIQDFERTGQIHETLLNSMTRVLNVDPVHVESLRVLDEREVHSLPAEPVAPRVIVRLMPAVYVPWKVEERITSQFEAEGYCRELAKTMQKRVALIWSRRMIVFFDEKGAGVRVSPPDRTGKPIPRLSVGGAKIRI